MRLKVLYPLAGMLLLTLAVGRVAAQEGHPLVGSWHGIVGEGNAERDLTVIMDWDGTVVTGLVNPGFEHAELQNARLVSSDWTVSFELDFENRDGQSERCIVNGAIDRLGSDRRTVSGTWTCAGDTQRFEIMRDRDY
jgi:hypothetical protein